MEIITAKQFRNAVEVSEITTKQINKANKAIFESKKESTIKKYTFFKEQYNKRQAQAEAIISQYSKENFSY